VSRDGADVTCCGRPFHTRAAATGNDLSPTVDSRVRGLGGLGKHFVSQKKIKITRQTINCTVHTKLYSPKETTTAKGQNITSHALV